MASYYDQEPEDRNSYQKTVAMCVAAASLVVLLFLVILYVNSDKGTTSSRPVSDTAAEETEEKEDDILKESHNITSDELEFWNDAPKDKPVQKEEEGELTPYKDPQEDDKDMATDPSSTENNGSGDEKKKDGVNDTEESLNKEATGDKEYDKDNYYAIEDDNGKKTYYEIIKDVPRNDYNLENNLINENGLLTYKDS